MFVNSCYFFHWFHKCSTCSTSWFVVYRAYFLIVVSGGLLSHCPSTRSCFVKSISNRRFLWVTLRTYWLVTLFNSLFSFLVVVQDSAPYKRIDNIRKSKRRNFNFQWYLGRSPYIFQLPELASSNTTSSLKIIGQRCYW